MTLRRIHRWRNAAIWRYLSARHGKHFSDSFRTLNKFFLGFPIDCEYRTCTNTYHIRDNNGESLDIVNPTMITRYKEGISSRLESLAKEYLIPVNDIRFGDIVIDVGANIGELTRYLAVNLNAFVIAIEPEQAVLSAFHENSCGFEHILLQSALWSHDTTLTIYHASKTNDTTLIEPASYESSETIPVASLDNLLKSPKCQSLGPLTQIKLIKIEAEGAEPEIIQGARETISRAEFVTIDCGPERGVRSESTLVAVLNEMRSLDFIPIDFNPARIVVLFKSRRHLSGGS